MSRFVLIILECFD